VRVGEGRGEERRGREGRGGERRGGEAGRETKKNSKSSHKNGKCTKHFVFQFCAQ